MKSKTNCTSSEQSIVNMFLKQFNDLKKVNLEGIVKIMLETKQDDGKI